MLSTFAHVNYFTASSHKPLNICFSGARRAESLKLNLRHTKEGVHPCAETHAEQSRTKHDSVRLDLADGETESQFSTIQRR